MVVERFLAWMMSAPVEKRVEATSALARAYLHTGLGEEDFEMADAVMTVLLDDPATEVRHALAEAFASHPDAPRHIVLALAADTAGISALVLSRSPVFVDAELIDIVTRGTAAQQMAIAGRAGLSAAVATAIAGTGGQEACQALIENADADLDADSLHRIAQRFGTDAGTRRRLLGHPQIRPRTRVVLIEKLAEAMAAEVAAKARLPGARIEEITRQNCDKAIVTYAANVVEGDLDEIIETLIAGSRMTTAFLLRAVCMGHISLFARAMARLADAPLSRVEAVLSEDRRTVLHALYRKAELPDFAFGVFSTAIDSWRSVLASSDGGDAARLSYLVTRQVLSAYHASGDPQLDTLLVLLRKLAAETARDHARREIDRIAGAMRNGETPAAVPALAAPREEPETVAGDGALIEVSQEVITAFALHFAEEIVDLEEELAADAISADGGEAEIHAAAPGFIAAVDPEIPDEAIEIALQSLDLDEIELPDHAANDDIAMPGVERAASWAGPGAADQPALGLLEIARAHLGQKAAA